MKQQLKEQNPYLAGTYPSLLSRGLELPLSDENPPGKQTLSTGPPKSIVFTSGCICFLVLWTHCPYKLSHLLRT